MPDLQQGKTEEDEGRSYDSLTVEEQQDLYDRAAWDHLNELNALDKKQREARFKREEWLDRWQPGTATRCPKCGDTVLELKWSKEHTEWQCLEPTCRNQWEWRRK